MHRVDTATASPNENGGGFNGFTEGNPVTLVPPTTAGKAWFNDVQENICRAITGALSGIALVKGTYTQLYDAIVAIATNLLALRLSSDEFIYPVATYPTGKTRAVRIPLMPMSGSGIAHTATTTTLSSNSVEYHLDLGPYVSSGQTITRLRLRCDPGAARASGSNIRLTLSAIASDTTTAAAISEDDSSTTLQTVDSPLVSWVVAKSTERYVASIRAGNTAGSANDLLYWLELQYLAPGPRRD